MSEQILNLSEEQLWEIVAQTKVLVDQSPDQAHAMLVSNPTIGLAVLKAQIRLGMVTVESITAVLAARPAATSVAVAPPPPSMMGSGGQPLPPQQMMAPPPPPTHAPPPPPPQAPPPQVPPSQQAMIAQVMALTPQQIAALPPDQRAQVEALRAQFGAG